MNKAFDSVSRITVSLAIKRLQFPQDLQTMIHTLLSPHKYYIPHKKLVGEILATRGIRQGSKDGPILWTLCMHLVFADLAARYSRTCLHDHVIIYADDVHLRWQRGKPIHQTVGHPYQKWSVPDHAQFSDPIAHGLENSVPGSHHRI